MFVARTIHLQSSTAFFCVGIELHDADIVIDLTGLGGGR